MMCPKCGHGEMAYVGKQVVERGWISDKRGINTKKRYIEIQTYRCPKCRYEEKHERDVSG